MSLVRKVTSLLALLLMLTGYGTAYGAGNGPAAGYPFRHNDFDFKVAWKSAASDRGTAIDGLLKNVRYPSVAGVDLTVRLVDRENRVLAGGTAYPIPQRIMENDYSPFHVILRHGAPAKGDLLQFMIWYRINEGGQGGDHWLSSFVVDASTGEVVSRTTAKPDEW